jgi:hypothetical protein
MEITPRSFNRNEVGHFASRTGWLGRGLYDNRISILALPGAERLNKCWRLVGEFEDLGVDYGS